MNAKRGYDTQVLTCGFFSTYLCSSLLFKSSVNENATVLRRI